MDIIFNIKGLLLKQGETKSGEAILLLTNNCRALAEVQFLYWTPNKLILYLFLGHYTY